MLKQLTYDLLMTNNTATFAQVQRRARALACTVVVHRDREGLEHEVLADAPDGFVFRAAQVHQLVCTGADGTPLADLYADMLDRLELGVVCCDDPACDVCEVAQ
jgi:hypothetical protein